jgi:16S rRNA processing protein RimM
MEFESTYRAEEIIGFQVVTSQGEDLGTLKDVLPTGSNDVYIVGEGNKEILIPALKTVVLNIDKNARRIVVALPKGLRESQRA